MVRILQRVILIGGPCPLPNSTLDGKNLPLPPSTSRQRVILSGAEVLVREPWRADPKPTNGVRKGSRNRSCCLSMQNVTFMTEGSQSRLVDPTSPDGSCFCSLASLDPQKFDFAQDDTLKYSFGESATRSTHTSPTLDGKSLPLSTATATVSVSS